MIAAPADLVLPGYESEAQAERLFTPDHSVLAKKNVASRRALTEVLQHDWEKFALALLTVQHQRADHLLRGFFDDCPEMAVYAIAAVRGNRLYHLGFEIGQPLDLVESSMPCWLAALNQNNQQAADESLRVSKVLRFPASNALQARVGAYTEIMRIWLRAGDQELMLELFDIYHPVQLPSESTDAGQPARRDAQTPLALAPHQRREFARLFRADRLWHYAFYVDSPSKVVELHTDFHRLTERASSYKLVYAAPVKNNFEGSFHTKLLNRFQRAEIEFVTQLYQPVQVSARDFAQICMDLKGAIPMNTAQHVERIARSSPAKPALIFETQIFSYEQLNTLSNRAANGFAGLGIARGDRVAIWLPNTPAFIFAYLGALKLGAVAVTINTALKSEEIQFILDDSGARLLLTTADQRPYLPDGAALRTALPDLDHILIAEGNAQGAPTFQDLLAQAAPEAVAVAVAPHQPAVIHYTSGTIGFPKGALLSHDNVVASAQTAGAAFDLRPDDRVLLCLPAFHSFGQTAVLNPCFEAGATLVLHRQFEPGPVLQSVQTQGVTHFFGVPTTYALLHEQAAPDRLASVRRFISAGAPLPLELARQWDEKFGLAINDGYGLTETCLATYNRDPRSKPGSVGTPLSGVQVRVVTETGELAPAGQLGEVLVQSPSTMLGYWNRPPDTAEMLQDSWFRTGDIGRLDGDGYLYIVDRIKDMINVGGVKVYSSEVENILYRHPAVREAAVYGVPEPVFGELVCANVVLRAGQNASAPDLIRFCHEHMAYFKVPSVVEFVEALPKGRSGKVLKRELRARMQGQLEQKLYGQPLLAEEASATEARIVERATRYFYPRTSEEYEVAYLWEELFGVAPIGLYDNFFDLGGNSLLALRLMIEIRQKFGKQFPLSVLLQYPTVEKFAGLLQSGEAKPWSALVPLNTKGSKPPFFFLPGAGAIGPYLYPLAHALGDDQPFYTLESVGLDGVTPPHKTVEEDAAYFIEVIKQVQPHGPYYLGGHSHGGLQAFEMAQQLHKAGETVAALILVEAFPIQDTPVTFDQIAALVVKPDGEPAPVQQAPKATPEPPQAESQTAGVTDQAMNDIEMFVVMEKYYTEEYGAGLGLDNAFTAETLAPLTFEERLQKLKEAMDRVAAPQAANLMEVRGMVNVFIANLAIVYHPKDVAPIPITYFAGRDFGPEAIQWRKDGWEKYGPVELHIMPGGHTTGITEVPFVRETAREMADCLQRARDASQKMKAEG